MLVLTYLPLSCDNHQYSPFSLCGLDTSPFLKSLDLGLVAFLLTASLSHAAL